MGTLDHAEQQVRDYLDTVDEAVDHAEWKVSILPQIGEFSTRVSEVRRATSDAAALTSTAALEARRVVRDLRQAGFSVTDTAAILGVSRARVSQLAHG